MTSSTADVVVVGGGTVGAWTAVQLAERGAGRVVLVEAKTLGAGASGRARLKAKALGLLVAGADPARARHPRRDAIRQAIEGIVREQGL